MPIPSNCPLCGADADVQTVTTTYVFGDDSGKRAFYHCGSCMVHYQFPQLTPQEEKKFYAEEFESFMSSRAGPEGGWQGLQSHVEANKATFDRRMNYLAPHLNEGSKVLEVGCSSGFMLLPLQAQGYECIGVEPSGVFSEFVASKGIEIYSSVEDLPDNKSDGYFDLIMHYFVLEHISTPAQFISRQLDMLRPGGKIVIEIPCAQDPLHSLFDIPEFEKFYWSKAHPWYFTYQSLSYLLDQLSAPYEIIKEQRYDFSNHFTWAQDGRPGGMERYSRILGVEFDQAYRQALIAADKYDTLVAVVTKEWKE